MFMHALHTVHEVPDLRLAAGRLRDGSIQKAWSFRPHYDHGKHARTVSRALPFTATDKFSGLRSHFTLRRLHKRQPRIPTKSGKTFRTVFIEKRSAQFRVMPNG